MAESVLATMEKINAVCHSAGGKYGGYRCQVVSWDDVCRGTVDGSLSCWGANITDTYLKSKTGQQLFTVRSDNWNEKLGVVQADEVAVVAANGQGPLQPVTLRSFLQQLGQYGGYAGLQPGTDLSDAKLDMQCSIRFQTTFLPVNSDHDARGTLEFATEAYNYNTMSDQDPRNLVLLCTSQGVAVQQDGRGAKMLFHHAADEQGIIHRYWLEAEESRHAVGGQQLENEEERVDALKRGKATSSVIGTRAMGQRFNVLMTIQVPLQQQQQKPRPTQKSGPTKESANFITKFFGYSFGVNPEYLEDCDDEMESCTIEAMNEAMVMSCSEGLSKSRLDYAVGRSSAARVSRGSEVDTWQGLAINAPRRHPDEHVTVTVVIYNAVAGGVPSQEDVMAAIDDLESLYESCRVHGHLGDKTFDCFTAPLKAQDLNEIAAKKTFQPYQPTSQAVQNADIFPSF